MKQISTGTGLVVLSGTILASVFLSSPRTATTAFASAQQAQPAERSVSGNRDSNARMVADCQATESLPWFSTTPKEIQGCFVASNSGRRRSDLSYCDADMNNDGTHEYLVFQNTGLGTQYSLFLSTMETVAGIATSKLVVLCSFDSQSINDYRSSQGLPLAEGPGWLMEGLRDCDNDGDLDLIISSSYGADASFMYFENTGFQHAAQILGDVDGNGTVDTADVSLVLLNYSS